MCGGEWWPLEGSCTPTRRHFSSTRGPARRIPGGVNIYPDQVGTDRIEFDSLINVRPSQGNRSRSVEDPVLRQQIVNVVTGLIGA